MPPRLLIAGGVPGAPTSENASEAIVKSARSVNGLTEMFVLSF
jgi:hypothetical protein